MSRKRSLDKIVVGFAAASAAGLVAIGSLGGQSLETDSAVNTIAQGSVKEYFLQKTDSEVTKSEPSYEIIEITEPVTISPETTAPPETAVETTTLIETTVETTTLIETTAVQTTSTPQTTTTHTKTTIVPVSKTEYKVYWVENGKVWHSAKSCRTLKNSTIIYSGTISESGKERACKVCD